MATIDADAGVGIGTLYRHGANDMVEQVGGQQLFAGGTCDNILDGLRDHATPT